MAVRRLVSVLTGLDRFFAVFFFYDIKKTETRLARTLPRPRPRSGLNRSWSGSVPGFFSVFETGP